MNYSWIDKMDRKINYYNLPNTDGNKTFKERFDDLKPILDDIWMSYHKIDNINVLDIGCAEGLITNTIYQNYTKNITGIELSIHRIKKAKELYPYIKFINADINTWGFNQNFDIILFLGVFHFLPKKNRAGVLNEIMKHSRIVIIRTNYYRFVDVLKYIKYDFNMYIKRYNFSALIVLIRLDK